MLEIDSSKLFFNQFCLGNRSREGKRINCKWFDFCIAAVSSLLGFAFIVPHVFLRLLSKEIL